MSYTDRPIKGGNINRMDNEVYNAPGNNNNGNRVNQGQPGNLNPGQAGHPAAEGRREGCGGLEGKGPFNIFYFSSLPLTFIIEAS